MKKNRKNLRDVFNVLVIYVKNLISFVILLSRQVSTVKKRYFKRIRSEQKIN